MRKNTIITILLFASLILFTQCVQKTLETDSKILLTVLSSLDRLNPGVMVRGRSSADIKAAKNEYEAFQLIISTGDNNKLEDVKVEITDLLGENDRIGKENFEVFKAENVHLRKSSPRATFGPGLFPDPLLPFIDPVSGDSIQSLQRIASPDGYSYVGAKYSAIPIDIYPGQHCSI